jgi:8-oxo-dGTP pyrophosphatase MutT (NUDIX family)
MITIQSPPAPNSISQHCAFVFLVTPSGKIAGQHRDDIPQIDNPGKIAAFGGKIENGENAITAVLRELEEETSLRIASSDFIYFLNRISWRPHTGEWEVQNFYYTLVEESALADMQVYEGQGWVYIDGPRDPLLVDSWRPVVQQLGDILTANEMVVS